MIYLIAIFVYLLVLTGIAFYKSRQVRTQSDFSVAGRSLSPWILVCTMLAVWIGTGSIVGNAGKTYDVGLAALIIPIGSVLGLIILTVIAPKAREYEVFSVPEIIGSRYGQAARFLTVVALILAYMVIVSYQFNAGGAVLEVIFTNESGESLLSARQATIIAAAFIVLYTILAGLKSLAFTDIVTGIIIIVSLFVALPLLWFKAGGVSGMEKAFNDMGKPDHMKFWGVFSNTDIINFCLPSFLLILGDANQYQRYFASKNAQSARQAVTFMIFAVLVVESLIILEAWISASMIPDAEQGKYVLIYAAKQILPSAVGIIFLISIVGIIISTADSFLLIPATTFIRDIYTQYINPKAPEKRTIFFSRLLVLVFGIIAYLVSLAFAESTTIFEKALYAYTIYGSAITPCLLAAMFWKGATKHGAIASILSGAIVTLAWEEVSMIKKYLPESLSDLKAVLPAISISVLALIVVSRFTQKPKAS